MTKEIGFIGLGRMGKPMACRLLDAGYPVHGFDIRKEAIATIAEWNAGCAAGRDAHFGRPPNSMVPLTAPPFYAARVWPIVSNTQGGPVHDEEQRVLDAFGRPIPRLFAAGECGSVFGHLYMSGGNLAECFIGGRIAGRGAARGSGSAPPT